MGRISGPPDGSDQQQHGDNFRESIMSTLRGSDDTMTVKSLRKSVLLSLQLEDDDKDGKKKFKKTIQSLESDGVLDLSADGTISLSSKAKKEMKKKKKDKKKDKKRKRSESVVVSDEDEAKAEKKKKKKKDKSKDNDDEPEHDDKGDDENDTANGPSETQEEGEPDDVTIKDKNKPCKGNPQGTTRLFVGNLPFSVDEDSLTEFFKPGILTHIKWITDKETGRFYGSSFVEMKTSKCGAIAIQKDGKELMNRPIKINFAPAREGDNWPPQSKTVTGGKGSGGGSGSNNILNNSKGAKAGGKGIEAMGEKPDGCMKLFIGNLSYDIDDEGIYKFFGAVDAEVKAVRWLHHRDSGDFKGVGFVEFWNEEACNKAATLNGKNLLGRPIRIDWTD